MFRIGWLKNIVVDCETEIVEVQWLKCSELADWKILLLIVKLKLWKSNSKNVWNWQTAILWGYNARPRLSTLSKCSEPNFTVRCKQFFLSIVRQRIFSPNAMTLNLIVSHFVFFFLSPLHRICSILFSPPTKFTPLRFLPLRAQLDEHWTRDE